MAIHDLWSFDNSPAGTSLVAGTTDLTRVTDSTNPFAYYTGNPGMVLKDYSNPVTAVTSDGFLTLTRDSNGCDNPVIVGVNQVQNWSYATKFWMGFRTKANYATTVSSTGKILCSVVGFNNALGVLFVNENDVVAAANAESYVEVYFDTVGLTFQTWVNGTLIRSGTFTSATLSNAANMYFQFGTGSTTVAASSTRGYRDFYFLDMDATDTARLGPIRSTPAVLASASGSEWVLNGSPASLLAALNTVLPNPPTMSPSASSPADNQALTLALSTAIPASTPILAVQPQYSYSTDSAANSLDVTLSQAGSTIDPGAVALTSSTIQYNQRSPLQRKAPDGGNWTVAKIGATNLILTPSVVKTAMLMHFDGANGSGTFTDAAKPARVFTDVGGLGLSTAASKFGGASLYATNSGNINTPVTPELKLAGDFTVEFWVNPASTSGGQGLTSMGATGIFMSGALLYVNDDTGSTIINGAGNVGGGGWYHVALSKSGTTTRLFVNGNVVATTTSFGTYGVAGGPLYIGSFNQNSMQFWGFIDELRISSVARYTANFTPPTAAFTLD